MNSNEYKDKDNITKGREKSNATKHKKHRYRRKHDSNHHSSSVTYFVGETPNIDRILCLLSEKLERGVTWDKFHGKFNNYILKKFRHAEEVVCIATDMEDQTTAFEAIHTTEDLTQ